MGGEVIMQLKGAGAVKKLHKLLKAAISDEAEGVGRGLNYTFIGPDCAHKKGFKPDCWINFKPKGRVEVGYTHSFGNSDWAQAVAISIYTRLPISKGGWDSIGFCKDLEEFKRSKPFRVSIYHAKRLVREYSKKRPFDGELQTSRRQLAAAAKHYKKEIEDLKRYSKEYLKAAEAIFNGK